VIEHLLANKSNSEFVTFFFPRFDDAQSLQALTVIRSIIRQSLDATTLSQGIESSLLRLEQDLYTDLDGVMELLRLRAAESTKFYLVIDALDEFGSTERRKLLTLLSSLASACSKVKIFLSGRASSIIETKERLPNLDIISMSSIAARSDIAKYIENELQELLQNKDLIIGEESLVEEIRDTLTHHADGM